MQALPRSELAEFRSWFAEFDAVAWDQQLESDAAAGKLDVLAAEALADYETGSPQPFEAHSVTPFLALS